MNPFEEFECIEVEVTEGMVKIDQSISEVALYSPDKARDIAHRIINAADVADHDKSR